MMQRLVDKPLNRITKFAGFQTFSARPCLTLICALFIVSVTCGCKRAESPEATFLHIREEMRRGQLEAAQRDVESAFAKYQAHNQEWATRFLVLKAHVIFLRGSYNEALKILNADLPPSLSRSDVAVHRKMVQGLAHTYLQQYKEADVRLKEAEDLGNSIDSSFLGDVSQARGILEIDQKRYPEANAAFSTALSISRRKDLPYLEVLALGNLGNVAMWQEHYDEAIDRFKAALEKSQSLHSLSSQSRAHGNMGWNYMSVGDFDNAESSLKEAESKSAQAGLSGERVYWLQVLGEVYYLQHRPEEANRILQQALSLARTMDNKRTLTECLNNLAYVKLSSGLIDQAEAYDKEAIELEKAGLDHFGVLSSMLLAGRIQGARNQNLEAARTFENLLRDSDAETELRWQAHAGLAQVFAKQGKNHVADAEFRAAINTIEGAWNKFDREEFRLTFLSAAIDFYAQYVNFLISQNRSLDALKVADLSRAQTLEHGLSLSADAKPKEKKLPGKETLALGKLRPEDIARRQNATLLFYWLGESRSYLWVIAPSKTTLFPLPKSGDIDAAVKSYRDTFVDPRDPFESGKILGTKLYESLVLPAEKLIPKDSRVIILPDGSLNSFNFETLIVPGPQPHYWIEDATISIANSLSLLARARLESPPKAPTLLLFGDALFASKEFPVLPDSAKETDILKKYFPGSHRSLFTKADAKASTYLSSNPGQYSYLHFATHGTASSARPLESAIILSPEGDSFKLYARDIVQRPLNAYLVTVSACNGAGVKVYAGEGLIGLSWAFLRAGAHNVIGGLWEVSNASTPQLMDELYKGLNKGDDPALALRNAKLSFVHSTEYYSRPFYWAPFQLYSGS